MFQDNTSGNPVAFSSSGSPSSKLLTMIKVEERGRETERNDTEAPLSNEDEVLLR